MPTQIMEQLMTRDQQQKNNFVLAYRIWSVTRCEAKLSLIDKPPRFKWAIRLIEVAVQFFTVQDKPHTEGGLCRGCRDNSNTKYALAMYARARFGQRTPRVSIYA